MAIIDKIQLSGTVYTIGNETTTAVTSASTDNEIPTAKAVYDAIPQGGGGKAISAGTNISITTGETADTINCTLPIETINNAYGVSQIYVGDNIYKNNNYQAIVIASKDDSSTGQTIVEFAHGAISIGSSNKVFQNGIVIGENSTAGASNSWNHIAIGYNTVATGTTKTNISNQIKVDANNQVYIYNKDNTEMICLQDQLGGGGSITIDPLLDSGSTNAVANSAITNAINSKMDEVNFASFYGDKYSAGLKGYYYDSQTETQTEKFNWGMVWQSDGSIGFDSLGNLAVFNKIDTSAITTSVTSSSTDSQVPSAKAVYDIVGNIETLLSKI